jgi:predicted PurR-regulated permease PerM
MTILNRQVMKDKMLIGLLLTLFFCLLTAVLNIEFPNNEVIPYIGSALIWCSMALFLYGGKECDKKR